MPTAAATIKRTIAVTELLLISPAALFMTALFVRNLQPDALEPAHSAQRIVMWYAGRVWTLWVLLLGLPLAVLLSGSLALRQSWRDDPELRAGVWRTLATLRVHLATFAVAAATLASAAILAIVALHALSD